MDSAAAMSQALEASLHRGRRRSVKARRKTSRDDEEFSPYRDFKSPGAALAYCEQFRNPRNKLWLVIQAGADRADYCWAAECLMEMERLDNGE